MNYLWVDVFTSGAVDDEDVLCFSAVVDEKGRLVVPAYVRRKLGIARNALVSVVVEPVSRVKRFRAESDCDAERILEYVDDAVSYRCEGEYLEVACGRGRGRGAK